MAMELAMLILARNAVSASADLALSRFATSSALWKLNKTVVDAYRALYVKIAIRRRDRKIVVTPRRSR
jgi:hypothetical protein